MKIVCDACQAKYSISDDKVQGKVFKIRCKKCSNIIVVRGGGGGAEAAAAPEPQQAKETRVYDYGYEGGDQAPAGDESVWHVVINQDQVGPMTAAEIQGRFSAGEIDAETYIWREGFADWLPIAQVDTFAAFVASGQTGQVPPSAAGGGRDAVQSMFGGGGTDDTGTMRNADPADLFAAASSPRAAEQHHDDDGGDLFGQQQQPRTKAPTGAPDAAKLRGERNENSVLFSLGNLAQLASNNPAPVTSTPSGHATGQAGGEGSGLIDIRSMANAYLGGGATPAKSATSSVGSMDDLPVFSGGGFAEPAVFVPSARPANNNKVLYAMIGAVGLLAIIAVVLVLVLVKGSGGEKPAAVAAVVPPTAPAENGGTPTPTPPVAPAPTDNTATPPAGSAAPAQVATNDKPPPADNTAPTPTPAVAKKTPAPTPAPAPKHNVAATPGPTHETPAPVHQAAAAAPKDPPAAKTPAGGGGDCDEVGCLLNNNEGACCAKFKKKKAGGGGGGGGGGDAPAAPKSDLPDTLDRDMISAGVGKVKARVMACGDKSSAKGTVKVHVKVSGAGTVSDASASASPDPALGDCVAGAMKRATFAKTQSGGSFSYPFVF